MDILIWIIVYFISIILLGVIWGEIRYRYKEKQLSRQKNNEKQIKKKANHNNGFYRVDYRVSENCCNRDSYGTICVKCGRCGRKFHKKK